MLLVEVALKFVPVMETVAPLAALVGVKDEMVGAGIKVKPGLVTVPPGVVTDTFPVVPDATTAVMLVAETTVNEFAAVPPKVTAVAPVKLVPVIVTVDPLPALVGINEVIVGAGITLKLVELVAVWPPTVTVIAPVVAPEGTEVVMLVLVLVVTVALVPLNITVLFAALALKFVPVIVTDVPTGPLVGLKLVMVGGGVTIVLRKTETVLLL